MRAIDSDEHEDVPAPGKKRGQWTAKELQEWMKWYRTFHEETREILDADDEQRLLESRSWMIQEMIAKTQENGVRIDLSNGDELCSCSDRLRAVIKELRGYPIIRKLALREMDIERFVANPEFYAQEKVKWKRTNLNRSTARDDPGESPGQQSEQRNNAAETNSMTDTVDDVSAVTASKSKKRKRAGNNNDDETASRSKVTPTRRVGEAKQRTKAKDKKSATSTHQRSFQTTFSVSQDTEDAGVANSSQGIPKVSSGNGGSMPVARAANQGG
jgi:hypothetical protein